jgi:hypothetical protein
MQLVGDFKGKTKQSERYYYIYSQNLQIEY